MKQIYYNYFFEPDSQHEYFIVSLVESSEIFD